MGQAKAVALALGDRSDCETLTDENISTYVRSRRYLSWAEQPEPRGFRGRFAARADVELA